MKAYRIERIKNGMKFTCTQCAHSVSTLDFEAKAAISAPKPQPQSTITPLKRTTNP